MVDLNAQAQPHAAASSHMTALQQHNVQLEAQQKMQAARELSLRSFYPEELSSDQERMVAALAQFFGSEQQVFLLKGFAGTGKTFLLGGILRYLRALEWPSLCCAPTGKAAQVLRDKTGKEAFTIHQAIYNFKEIFDCVHPVVAGKTLKREEYDAIVVGTIKGQACPSCHVMLVDESSMISDIVVDDEDFICGTGRLLSDIFTFLQLYQYPGRKVIFIGDEAQLPPVGSKNSPALSAKYIKEHFGYEVVEDELCSIVRQQAQSAILQNSLQLRQGLQHHFYQEQAFTLKSGEVETAMVQDTLLQDLAWRYQLALSQSRMPPLTVICYSNHAALGYNLWIRHFLFGLPYSYNDDPPLVEHPLDVRCGDLLLVLRNNYKHELFNGQLVVLGNFDPNAIITRSITLYPRKKYGAAPQMGMPSNDDELVRVTLKFLPVELWCNNPDGTWLSKNVMLLTNALYSSERSISRDEQRALFVDFIMRHRELKRGSAEFINQLFEDPYYNAVQVHFGYALTCHKAQGSEWKQVFVDCKGVQQSNEYSFRWLYTAITRAKSQLTLMNYSARKVASNLKIASTFKKFGSSTAPGVVTAQLPPELDTDVFVEPGCTLDAPNTIVPQEAHGLLQDAPRSSAADILWPEVAQPRTTSDPAVVSEPGWILDAPNTIVPQEAHGLLQDAPRSSAADILWPEVAQPRTTSDPAVVSEPGWILDEPSTSVSQKPLGQQQDISWPEGAQLQLQTEAATVAQSNATASSPAAQLVSFCADLCRKLSSSQLQVTHLASCDYQEQLTISDENAGTSMIVQVYYGGNDCYSKVQSSKGSLNPELRSRLLSGLQDALRGRARYELTQARNAAVVAPPPDMGNAGFNQYLQRLQAQLAAKQIVTVSWQQLQYVLRVKFQAVAAIDFTPQIAAGENVEIDIGYNGKYAITYINPARKGEGEKPLGQVVLEVISNL